MLFRRQKKEMHQAVHLLFCNYYIIFWSKKQDLFLQSRRGIMTKSGTLPAALRRKMLQKNVKNFTKTLDK